MRLAFANGTANVTQAEPGKTISSGAFSSPLLHLKPSHLVKKLSLVSRDAWPISITRKMSKVTLGYPSHFELPDGCSQVTPGEMSRRTAQLSPDHTAEPQSYD